MVSLEEPLWAARLKNVVLASATTAEEISIGAALYALGVPPFNPP
jgi:hypothetical protein